MILHLATRIKFVMAQHGSVGPFDQGKEDWTAYTERLEQYFAANDVKDTTKQRAILLSACGARTYQVIHNLTAPGKPTEHSFGELVELVKNHFSPPPSVIVQQFTFNTHAQREGETIAEFVAKLCRLSKHCKFGDTLEDMLHDRIVCGIRDTRLQRRLLAEIDLTYQKAFDMCQATELAHKNSPSLQTVQPSLKPTSQPILTLRPQARSSGRKQGSATQSNCYRCNSSQHIASNCPFKTAECHHCGKKGHIIKACRSKSKGQTAQPRFKGKKPQSTHQLCTDADDSSVEDEEDQPTYELFKLSQGKVTPIVSTSNWTM